RCRRGDSSGRSDSGALLTTHPHPGSVRRALLTPTQVIERCLAGIARIDPARARRGSRTTGVARHTSLIAAEIAQRTGREMLQGSVYAILERLESKGFVTSRLGEATLQRGGRAKRYFALTAEGSRQMRETQRALEALWQGLAKPAGTRS